MVDYSETIEVYGVKAGIYSKLNEYMHQRSRSFFDLCPSLLIKFLTAFALKPLDRLVSLCTERS